MFVIPSVLLLSAAMSDYYQVLGIAPSATEEEVKRSFKKLAVKYHPDKTDNKDHHQLFIKINEAYETLKSPEARRKYNSKFGISPKPDYTYTSTTTFTTSRTSFARGGAGVYYDYYRRHEREAEDSAREAARQRQEAQEALNAKFAREKEELERRRKEEALKRLQQWKEEQLKQQQALEQQAQEARARRIQIEEEAERIRQEQLQRKRQEEFLRNQSDKLYDEDEVEEYAHTLSEAGDLNNPIVVEDEDEIPSSPSRSTGSNLSYTSAADGHLEVDSRSETQSQRDGRPSEADSNPVPGESLSEVWPEPTKAKTLAESTEKTTFLNMAHLEKLLSEGLNSNFKTQRTRRSVSPTRPKFQTPLKKKPYGAPNVVQASPAPVSNSAKKMKFDGGIPKSKSPEKNYDFSEFDAALGTDIDNVDLSDIYDSLPNSTGKPKENNTTRKMSENITNTKKKPRLAEYTNGRTKADTIHIPVNRTVFSGHPSRPKPRPTVLSPLSVLDLHASPAIHEYTAPSPPNSPDVSRLTSQAWKTYVAAINAYEKRFSDYKKHIIQYQFERFKKDEEFYDTINNDTNNFEVYQTCLSRDFEVLEEYHSALRDFITTMQNYKQNCSWMQMARLGKE